MFITIYVYTADSITKYIIALQHCKRNPFLHFHGNTQRSYVVDRYCTYRSTTLKKDNALFLFYGKYGYANALHF
jgi:hypothetical protein